MEILGFHTGGVRAFEIWNVGNGVGVLERDHCLGGDGCALGCVSNVGSRIQCLEPQLVEG